MDLSAIALPPPDLLLAATGTFVVAGIIKGIVGFGLPTVALSILAATIGLKPAIALTVFPALFTNVWQALAGGRFWPLLRRLAPLLAAIIVGIWIGTRILARVDGALLTVLLGVLVALYAAAGLARWRPPAVGDRERWLAPPMGLINGTVTGVTGTFIMPGVLYLQALRLSRDALIQGMGIVFLISTAVLGGFLREADLMPTDLAIASLAATPGAFLGMWIGQRIRAGLSDVAFDRAFFVGLLLVGLFLAVRNIGLVAA